MASQQENRDRLIRAIEAQRKAQEATKKLARALRTSGVEEALVPQSDASVS